MEGFGEGAGLPVGDGGVMAMVVGGIDDDDDDGGGEDVLCWSVRGFGSEGGVNGSRCAGAGTGGALFWGSGLGLSTHRRPRRDRCPR